MIAAIVLLAVAAPKIPGARQVVEVHNASLQAVLRPNQIWDRVVSDDGSTAFVNEGKLGRYSLTNSTSWPVENLFYATDGRGSPYSLTTSQVAHVAGARKGPGGPGGLWLLSSPSENSVLLTSWLDKWVVVSNVRIDKRGQRPNFDWALKQAPAGGEFGLLGAIATHGSVRFWIQRKLPPFKKMLDEYVGKEGRAPIRSKSWPIPRGNYVSYDPASGLLLGQDVHGTVALGRRGSVRATMVKVPRDGELFLSQGAVFCQTDIVSKLLTSGNWTRFAAVRVLAKSASGKFWLVQSDGRLWLARF